MSNVIDNTEKDVEKRLFIGKVTSILNADNIDFRNSSSNSNPSYYLRNITRESLESVLIFYKTLSYIQSPDSLFYTSIYW